MQPTHSYRRNLPHIQRPGKTYFVTFCTKNHWILPEATRSVVLDTCRAVHEITAFIHCAVIMPDHVHLILTPMADSRGETLLLEKVLRQIKGVSALKVNKALNRHGPVWQAESFDHMLRSMESAESKSDYSVMNPVRRGLALRPEEYPWYWRPQ